MTLNDVTSTTEKRKELSELTRGRIIGMYESDKTVREISDMTNVPLSTVKKVLKYFKEHGTEVPPKRSGRPKALTSRDQSALIRAFRKAPHMPLTTQHALFTAGGINCSLTTFRKYKKEMGFSSY